MATVNNHDVVGLHDLMNIFIGELANSQSSGASDMLDADQARASEYLATAKGFKAWVVGHPPIDLPKSHPTEWTLGPNPEIAWDNIVNESVKMLLRLLVVVRDEISLGQSAPVASGLNEHDALRFDAIVEKAEKFLTDYVATATPQDLPETSPPPGQGA